MVGVAGSIGYLFKLLKGGCLTNYTEKDSENTNSRIVATKERKDFRFIGTNASLDKRMVFQGGVARDSAMFRSNMLSRITNDLEH